MYFNISKRRIQGLSLVEVMISMGVFSVAAAALGMLLMFGARSVAQLSNYAELDASNREAVDRLTREIRQSQYVIGFNNDTNASWLTLKNGAGQDVTYSFNGAKRTMERTVDGVAQTLLTNCTILNFNCYQRNPMSNDFRIYNIGANNPQKYIKAVELTWRTRKTLNSTTIINSENVQTARIIIRKQQED
jgi:Tfp pilus assembly protein PilV